jgi:plastocyanin
MNKFTLFLMMALSCVFVSAQTTHQVEAGGGPGSVSPYFSPQNITIQVGDIVEWNNIYGTHNIDGTLNAYPNNPEAFSYMLSGQAAPWTWSYTFNTPGYYEYECSLWNHAQTQFGSITVVDNSGTAVQENANSAFSFYPNPAKDYLMVQSQEVVHLYNTLGEKVLSTDAEKIDLSSFPQGIYLIESGEERHKFIKQ